MAAAKSGAVKGRQMKKGIRGRIPVKRTINLVPVNEDKISLKLAIPGILLILVLAGLFSKFLVIDRLTAMSKAAARTARPSMPTAILCTGPMNEPSAPPTIAYERTFSTVCLLEADVLPL